LAIKSNSLVSEVIFLFANEEQAMKVEAEGKLAYTKKEIRMPFKWY
jgi:hypothetical protein